MIRNVFFVMSLLGLSAAAFGQECFDLQKALKAIPENTRASVVIEGAKVITKHQLLNLAIHNKESFLIPYAGSYSWAETSNRFRSGSVVTKSFIEKLRKDLSIESARRSKPGSSTFSMKSTLNKDNYDNGLWLLSFVFRELTVDLPFGYSDDNTSYPILVQQRKCSQIHSVGRSAPDYDIVAGTANSLHYVNKESGELFKLSYEGAAESGTMTLVRTKYATAPVSCGEETRYETHPVEVTYKLRWGSAVTDGSVQTSLSVIDDVTGQILPGANETEVCSLNRENTEDKTFETPETKDLHLPTGRLLIQLETGHMTENSLLAKNWLNSYLGSGFMGKAFIARIRDGSEWYGIKFAKETNHAKLAQGLELLEFGTLSTYAEAQICRDQGHYSEFSAELLKRHPELNCIVRMDDRKDMGNIDNLTGEVSIIHKRQEINLIITGIPLVMADEIREGLSAYMRASSSDPAFQKKDDRGKWSSYPVMSLFFERPEAPRN